MERGGGSSSANIHAISGAVARYPSTGRVPGYFWRMASSSRKTVFTVGYLLDLVLFFEFCGAAATQGAVQPGAVVPGDVLHDRPAGHGPGRPGLKVEQLAFDRGGKRFGKVVVPAVAGAAV